MNECQCDYPVNLRRARRAFARASKQLDAAFAEHREWLQQYSEKLQASSPPGTWLIGYDGIYQLMLAVNEMRDLNDLAQRTSELRLTRKEICLMAEAERTDYIKKWDARVAYLKTLPEPVPYKKPEPVSFIPYVAPEPPKRPSIWSSIFGY